MSNHERRTTSIAAADGERLEHWALDAGDDAVGSLLVPPHASRERRFEISCSMSVSRGDDAPRAWHQMRVLVDGMQQWQRRVDTHAGVDGLDVRFERNVPPGRGLRIVVEASCEGARRRTLLIEADEVRD